MKRMKKYLKKIKFFGSNLSNKSKNLIETAKGKKARKLKPTKLSKSNTKKNKTMMINKKLANPLQKYIAPKEITVNLLSLKIHPPAPNS